MEEAGGRVSDPAGRPLRLAEYVNIAASNGLVHDEFIDTLAWRDTQAGDGSEKGF